jgi:hypothetical protein
MDEEKWFVESDESKCRMWLTKYDKRGGVVMEDYRFELLSDKTLIVSDETRDTVYLSETAAKRLKVFLNSLKDL